MTLENDGLKWSTQILIVEESKVSWEIKPLALLLLALCSNQLITSQGRVCVAPCVVLTLSTLLKLDKVYVSVGFHWCLIKWPVYPSLSRIFLILALNVPHSRNLLGLGQSRQVVTLVPGIVLLQLWWCIAPSLPPYPFLIVQYMYFSFSPYVPLLCCNYVGKILDKLNYTKMY